MDSKQVSESGWYWWSCPSDDGPLLARGKTAVVLVRVEGELADCFRAGDPLTYRLRTMPGTFSGPIKQE